jgi:hypothetical protein
MVDPAGLPDAVMGDDAVSAMATDRFGLILLKKSALVPTGNYAS